jgi:type II secretory pathway component PulJ
MIRALKFILKSRMKCSRVIEQEGGFTLIELLVALLISFLVITPLLGFMINIMNTDRQEQAKANSEQELQAALDYLNRDLQQAVYIYDATGIDAIKAQLPDKDATDKVPVLVFWKRELVSGVIEAEDKTKDDAFIYSLVAYYLIKDTSSTWSKAARIARWQLRDGLSAASGVDCTGYTGKYISGNCPDTGFAPFKLDGSGSLEKKMNEWTKATTAYDLTKTPFRVLVDFIDQTTTGSPTATCPSDSTSPVITWSKVTPTSFNTIDTGKMTGFYACIDRANTTAQVILRGNALARIETDSSRINYIDEKKTYFPTTSIRVQGRGYLFK